MRRWMGFLGQSRTLILMVPVAYMVWTHLSWVPDRNSRIRMGLKQLGFWGAFFGFSIPAVHLWSRRITTVWGRWGLYGAAMAAPVLGYEGLRRVAKRFFPTGTPHSENKVSPVYPPWTGYLPRQATPKTAGSLASGVRLPEATTRLTTPPYYSLASTRAAGGHYSVRPAWPY